MSFKTLLRPLLVLAVLSVATAAAESEVEFVALLSGGTAADTRIMLAVPGAGSSGWLKLGQEFRGYTVASYEAKEETVVLSKDGQTLRVKLKDSKVKAGVAEPPPAVQKQILNNLRMLSAAADQFYLENGVATTTYDQLVGPTKYVKQITPQAGEDYRAIEFKQGKAMEITTTGGFKMRYAP